MLLFFRHHLKLSCSLLIVNHTPLKMISDKAVCIGPHVILENSPFPPTKIQLSDSCSMILRKEGCKSSLIFKNFDCYYYCWSFSNFQEKLCRVQWWSLELPLQAPYSVLRSGHFDTTANSTPVELMSRVEPHKSKRAEKGGCEKSDFFLVILLPTPRIPSVRFRFKWSVQMIWVVSGPCYGQLNV